MADQYVPPTRVNPLYPGVTPTGDAINPDGRSDRINPDRPTNVRVEQSSGFGTGLMVAIVFVVVAGLAYAFYNPSSSTTNQGDLTIEQNAAPAPVIPDANPGVDAPLVPLADPAVPSVADPKVPSVADPAVPSVADPATPPVTTDTAPVNP